MLQNQELEKSSTHVRFQRAMDQAIEEFTDEEASVYQQGSKLIFRLKKINFASGSATIPVASKPMLSKINDIIKFVGAELVAVEGHTDSVGAADLNKNLSTKRAISVANYLAALKGGYKIGYVGYGESRPIATNETHEGRAINRRVDLVVTAKK
ncbi:MAG: OmpA family protein [Gammaproteobacteria bacterium]|nr:OmpA family protein [Gammaproteobacteria bacterium]